MAKGKAGETKGWLTGNQPVTRLARVMAERREKLAKIRKVGIEPYPAKFERSKLASEVKEGEKVRVAGRIMGWREHGGSIFADVVDASGKLQVYFQEDRLGKKKFEFLKLLDLGDFVGVTGETFKTKAGEVTVRVGEYELLAKALRPLPTTKQELKNVEERYRRRYLDLLVNPESKRLLDVRWRMERKIREFLWQRDFVEVETPVLQPLYGGTNARPFTAHMNALDCDFYLRIAPELYLKRLIVGGYEKVFEIARNFRNEGMDTTHQPEFTMIEWYEAYGDYQQLMDTAEALIGDLVKDLFGGSKLKVKGHEVEVAGKWPREPMVKMIKDYLGLDVVALSDEELKRVLKENKLELVGEYSRGKATFAIFEHLVTDKLVGPMWVIDYPEEAGALQRPHGGKPGYVERFEGYMGGVEFADGWSEIVSAEEQRRRFEAEEKRKKEGDEEAHPMDEDFIETMEYGMPPLGGIGIGIERLMMVLTDTWSIRDVVAFPTLRPKKRGRE